MDDSGKTLVNGAWIDTNFLRENIAEAKSTTWEPVGFISNHHHCMICGIALGLNDKAYRSTTGWLCTYCFNTFILTGS
jgi:hypothetical protein